MRKRTIEQISIELTKEELEHIDTFFTFVIDEEYKWNDFLSDDDIQEIIPTVRKFWEIL